MTTGLSAALLIGANGIALTSALAALAVAFHHLRREQADRRNSLKHFLHEEAAKKHQGVRRFRMVVEYGDGSEGVVLSQLVSGDSKQQEAVEEAVARLAAAADTSPEATP